MTPVVRNLMVFASELSNRGIVVSSAEYVNHQNIAGGEISLIVSYRAGRGEIGARNI